MHRMLILGPAVLIATGTALAQGQTVPPAAAAPTTPPVAAPHKPTAGAIADPAAPNPAIAAITPSAQAFLDAFNRHDAKAVAALWATDGEYIDETGKRFAGRAAIEAEYGRFFADNPRARIAFVVDRVRQPDANTLIETGRTILKNGDDDETTSRYTVIHKRVDGEWRMASARDSSMDVSAEAVLNDLNWLVGTWDADEGAANVQSVCRWLDGRKFLERTFRVARDGKVMTSGVQLVGWNPQTQQLQSWIFTSDGGHAEGIWTPRESGWAIQTTGMLPDGTPTQAVNLFTRVDDNAFTWQSIERSVGEAAMPDTNKVLLKRVRSAAAENIPPGEGKK